MKNCLRRLAAFLLVLAFLSPPPPSAGESPALRDLRDRAAKGDSGAMNEIGVAYFTGDQGLKQDRAEALPWFRKAAEAGNAVAMNNLGIAYRDGEGTAADPIEAHRWFERAARTGHAWAQFSVGKNYYDGVAVEKDLAEAEKWFEKSAEQDIANSVRMLGVIEYQRYVNTGNDAQIRRAAELMRKAAGMGDATAQYNLGVFHENGMGVERDYAEAVRWFVKAADNGDSSAQLALGRCYLKGKGVDQDYGAARRWLTLALENGESEARDELAQLPKETTTTTTGGTSRSSLAGTWSGKAWGGRIPGLVDFVVDLKEGAGGYTGEVRLDRDGGAVDQAALDATGVATVDALVTVGGNQFTLSAKGKPEGDNWGGEVTIRDSAGATFMTGRFLTARGGIAGPSAGESEKAWVTRLSAEAGDADAMTFLGVMYLRGREGLPEDAAQAMAWFEKAAGAGDNRGAYNLGICHKAGVAGEPNPAEAYTWFLAAAERGMADAQEEIGFAHMLGRGAPRDLDAAEAWFAKAANQGSANAAMQVGNVISVRAQETGDSGRMAEAVDWFRKAAEAGETSAQYNLAVLYNNGDDVPEDFTEAGYWYERAARNGSAPAQFRLGAYYFEGKGREANPGKAKRWFTEALNNGDERAKEALALIPAGVEAIGDQPVRVGMDQLLRAFAADPAAARAKYVGAVLDVTAAKGNVDIDVNGSTLIMAVGDIPVAIHMRMEKKGGQSVTVGQPVRGFCCGILNGAVIMEGCRFIEEKDLAPETSGGLSGLWQGTYTDDQGGDSYRLRIDTASGVELVDEGLHLDMVETSEKDGLSTVRAAWTDDKGVKSEAFFTGPVQGDGWEGVVVVTSGADVLFQGTFVLKK